MTGVSGLQNHIRAGGGNRRSSMNRMSALIIAAATASFVGFAPASLHAQASSAEKPEPAEKNPPGDIPDNQVFIEYSSPLGFKIKVPEGWARRESSDGVTFNDKYNTIALLRSERSDSLTLANVKQQDVAELEKTGKAVRVTAVKSVKLPAGSAVVVSYSSNSEPNPVTEKAIREENERYFFWQNGKLVTLTLSSPYGADNADQWNLMSKSFRWQ
ncbi:hypothetical protein QCM80_31020 [Bradyrhizobium sp. SSUT112]|uniref:hypothetical protein n=1 Tax=Bradyrhizobium sp. SSUT112 TaxID=3040604 RepID=UPI002449CB7D|nr:hypothetical protein [Bradyrhizobium sp. SSUT112]MDH2355066.1 hypothetical protein [Bradyrhizobium sp. SSUT112]